ncbi:MAG TPA: hypothetical protein VJC13_00505 [Candidatus Paceibacterota bacterium]
MSKISFKKEYVSYGAVVLFGLLLSAVAASAATTISSTTLTGGGNITVPAAYSVDVASAGALSIGTTTATSVIIGSSSAKVGIASSSPYVALGVTGTTTSSLGVVVGSAGTPINQALRGSCALIYTSSLVTASSTKAFDCAVTGVLKGDQVFVQAATTTSAVAANSFGAFIITGASASSTAGYITIQITNFTGVVADVPREIASSTSYWIIR